MAETEVKVTVYRRGFIIDTITRPLRQLNGKPAVKYKRQLHDLVGGNAIHLDGPPPQAPAPPQVSKVVAKHPPPRSGWDPLQKAVIETRPEARLLVDAGPGTGKTAVACARVARLITQYDIQPTRIWLISFTRTAVREIRDRIAKALGDQEAAYAVRMATMDSHAWAIHSGFDEMAKIAGSYEKNIEDVLKLFRENDQVVEYLESVEHLIVDETQDVVGIRATLLTELVSRLSKSCGVTVFADEAQAIYGFADEDEGESGRDRQPPITEQLRKGGFGFEDRSLQQVFRTDSPNLLSLFTATRAKVLTPAPNPASKLEDIRKEVEALAHGEVPRIEEQGLEKAEDVLVLYRRRAEVLMASSFLNAQGVRHRIRMSGMPICIPPWVGACLGEHEGSTLTRTGFLALWKQRVVGTPCETLTADEAWEFLYRHAGKRENVVEMQRLRVVLARSQPPADFCSSELGTQGPIVGTIHASKGRESGTVHLMIPRGSAGKDTDCDAEARVVFVGATRARTRLMVGQSIRHYSTKLESSRIYSHKEGTATAQVEIGCDGDVSAQSAASISLYDTADEVRAVQERLLHLTTFPLKARAFCDREADFTYMLRTEEGGEFLGALTGHVNAELFNVAQVICSKSRGRRRPPSEIWHLHVVGVRTAVFPPNSPDAERMHAPWSTSGIVLVPVILGYMKLPFPYYWGRESHGHGQEDHPRAPRARSGGSTRR
ncbi:UvrD-helicase domain-containing protein [Corallococcus silvisoli]|uniref:UvrD-helicase domain-containing protein n=1 Tax=Corallococcus silvisoli TaxID=2697031 RepID=UPI0013775032|nr:UvrD family DEAD/DEAH box helicase [Corallococcus silvisoli]NBD14039.1 UvrD-helicase domain-containing protein [Corallococcus silvisoli]